MRIEIVPDRKHSSGRRVGEEKVCTFRRMSRRPAAASADGAADFNKCHNLSLRPVTTSNHMFKLGNFDLSDYVGGGTVIYGDAKDWESYFKIIFKVISKVIYKAFKTKLF